MKFPFKDFFIKCEQIRRKTDFAKYFLGLSILVSEKNSDIFCLVLPWQGKPQKMNKTQDGRIKSFQVQEKDNYISRYLETRRLDSIFPWYTVGGDELAQLMTEAIVTTETFKLTCES